MIQRIAAVLLLAAMACFPITKVSVPYRGVPGAAILSSGINRNSDTIYNAYNRMVDTLNAKFARYTAFRNHDSTFAWMNIDTVKGPVRIDTVAGRMRVDTLLSSSVSINGRALEFYGDTSFACTLYDGSTMRATGTMYAARSGSVITLHIPGMTGTVTTSTATKISPIPSDYRSSVGSFHAAVPIRNNGTDELGTIDCSSSGGYVSVTNIRGEFLTAGTGGLYTGVIVTYRK